MKMERLNNMCSACECLDEDCAGTPCQDWTGCIYRKTGAVETDFVGYQPLISRETREERGIVDSKPREGM